MRATFRARARRAFPLLTFLLCVAGAGCAGAPAGSPRDVASAAPTGASAIDPVQAMSTGERAYAREDWAGAESNFLAAARAARTDAEPWFRLGNVYFRTRRYDVAARAYEQALQRAPGHAKAWHNLGIVRLHQADASFEHVIAGADAHDTALDDRARHMRDILDDAIDPAPGAP